MTVELLFFDGCPGHERLLPAVRSLADRHGAELRLRRIETPQEAEEVGFLGSPSLRVDGRDVEPGAEQRRDYALKCRLYRSAEGHSGLPPEDLIERALREAARTGA